MAQVLGCTSAAACRNSRAETRRSGLGGSPEVRYILEAVSKPRPAALFLLLPLILQIHVESLPISGLVCALFRTCGRDAAHGTTLNLIRGGRRVRTYAPPNGTCRGGTASRGNWVPVHALSARLRFLSFFANWIIGGPRGIREYAPNDLFGVARRCRRKCFMRDNVCVSHSFCFPCFFFFFVTFYMHIAADARNEIKRKFAYYRNGYHWIL